MSKTKKPTPAVPPMKGPKRRTIAPASRALCLGEPVPTYDEDNDQWLSLTYHRKHGGRGFDTYDDDGDYAGDAERGEVPTIEACLKRWDDYTRRVAKTGDDPLRAFVVHRSIHRRVPWVVDLSADLEFGEHFIRVEGGRQNEPGRARLDADDLPREVLDFLEAERFDLPGCEPGVRIRPKIARTFAGLLRVLEAGNSGATLTTGRRLRFDLDMDEPCKPSEIQRELKAAARRALRYAESQS